MTTMVCANCDRTGIKWIGDLLNYPMTWCPHCGGNNCQKIETSKPSEGDSCPYCGEGDLVAKSDGILVCEKCGDEWR